MEEGEIVTLIGANGAGKTTILQTISGLLPAKSGKFISWDTTCAKRCRTKLCGWAWPRYRRAAGCSATMTVRKTWRWARTFCRGKERDNGGGSGHGLSAKFPRLKERRRQVAGTLSGGEQQMLAIGRALMSHPSMMLLDEPSMGLAPLLVQEIFDCIREVNKAGTTVLLVEQNAKKALSIADRAYVLETGAVVLEGRPPIYWRTIRSNTRIWGRRVLEETVSKRKQRQRGFCEGFRYGLPIMLGYAPVSFAFAVTAVAAGLPWPAALLISLTNFTSAGQVAGAGLLAMGAALPEIGVTVFVINIRYMLMSLSLSQKLGNMSLGKRLLLANGVTDEIFFLAMQKDGALSGWFLPGCRWGRIWAGCWAPWRGRLGGGSAAARLILRPGDRPVCHVCRHRGASGEEVPPGMLGGPAGGGAVVPVPLCPGSGPGALRLGADTQRGGDGGFLRLAVPPGAWAGAGEGEPV